MESLFRSATKLYIMSFNLGSFEPFLLLRYALVIASTYVLGIRSDSIYGGVPYVLLSVQTIAKEARAMTRASPDC